MKDIHTFVKHSGRWVKHERYEAGPGCAVGILIPAKATYEVFMQLLYATLNRSPKNQVLRVSYETEGSVPPVSIDSDLSLKCYLHLRKEKPDRSKLSLVVDMEPLKQEPLVSDSGVGSTPNTGQPAQADIQASSPKSEASSPEIPDPNQSHSGTPWQTPPRSGTPKRFSTPCSRTRRTSQCATPSTDNQNMHPDLDVSDIHSPLRLVKGGLYANKATLKKHLCMLAITKHFTFKTKTSNKRYIHVVCRDDSCAWSVRGVKKTTSEIFEVRR